MGAGACPISISGMEVGEVMEGQGTTYGCTLNVLFHIALCICVIGCLTWLGTILQMVVNTKTTPTLYQKTPRCGAKCTKKPPG